MKRAEGGVRARGEEGNLLGWKESGTIKVAKMKKDNPTEIPRYKEKAGWAYTRRWGADGSG